MDDINAQVKKENEIGHSIIPNSDDSKIKFEGSIQDFHIFIGPKIKNNIATLTKQKKTDLRYICQECFQKHELDAAHRHGTSRKQIIEKVLENYKILENRVKIDDLKRVNEEIINAHKPIDRVFRFLCKKCHSEYDQIPKIQSISKNISTENNSKPTSSKIRNSDIIPKLGEVFTEQQLHDKFQIRNTGGIRPTIKNKSIILINSCFSERQGGYKNHVDENEGFVYHVGESEGEQEFVRNNRSLLESKQNGVILLYFEKTSRDKLIFRHVLEYDSFSYKIQKNSKDIDRRVIVFKLKIIS